MRGEISRQESDEQSSEWPYPNSGQDRDVKLEDDILTDGLRSASEKKSG